MAEDVKNNDVLKGMSMMEKVARFFVLIGEDSTVKIFQHLPKDTLFPYTTLFRRSEERRVGERV